MKLKQMLRGLEGLKVKGDLEIEIQGIADNSKKVERGFLFVAIKGFKVDGHKFIENAIESGATAIMIEEGCNLKEIKIPTGITVVMAKNTREALAICANNFYGKPSTKLKLIGVTGTKGKTTTTYMIKEILEKAGKKVGLIGTIATYINGKKIKDSDRTTPESLELQQLFSQMAEQGVEYVVMEVSSQSLKLHRVDGCEFDIVLFTNFSEDHISPNEHPDMEDYFKSKAKLFEMCKTGIINTDDLKGIELLKLFPDNNITTYGIDNYANVLAKDITITNSYVDFKVKIIDRNEKGLGQVLGSVGLAPGAVVGLLGHGIGAGAVQGGAQGGLACVQAHGCRDDLEHAAGVVQLGDGLVLPLDIPEVAGVVRRRVQDLVALVVGDEGAVLVLEVDAVQLRLRPDQLVEVGEVGLVAQRVVGVEVRLGGHGQDGPGVHVHDDGAAPVLHGIGGDGLLPHR